MVTILCIAIAFAGPGLGVRVDGDGYMRFVDSGRVVFARQATIGISHGIVSAANGDSLLPRIPAPEGATGLNVDLQGHVSALCDGQRIQLGRLVLGIFPKSEVLLPSGDFLIAQSRPTLGNPGDDLNGVIRSGSGSEPVKTDAIPSKPIQTTKSRATVPLNTPLRLPEGKEAEIVINAESTVDGANYTLGDIAQIRGTADVKSTLDRIVMGRTPVLGVDPVIDIGRITSGLRGAQLRPENFVIIVPPGAIVSRKSQTVTKAQLVEAAVAAAAEKFGPSTKFVCVDGSLDFKADPGSLSFRTISCTRSSEGVSVTLSVDSDGRHSAVRTVNLVPEAGPGGVKDQMAVRVTIRSGGASVVLSGFSKSAGWIGEQVSVQVKISGAAGIHTVLLTGVVTGAGTVEVTN